MNEYNFQLGKTSGLKFGGNVQTVWDYYYAWVCLWVSVFMGLRKIFILLYIVLTGFFYTISGGSGGRRLPIQSHVSYFGNKNKFG